jgi:MFS transporter, FHS family, glucose/mannose:H+ symporter
LTEPGETSFTRVAFAAALGALALAGAVDAAYGPLLRPVTHRFGVSLPVAGTLISINFAGGLTGTLCALAGFRRFPRRPIATFALGMLGVGCLAIAVARAWPLLTIGVFLTGTGFGATDFSINQLGARTSARGRAARLTLLNAAFGAGAVLGPAVVGVLGVRVLSIGYAVAAGIAWIMAAGVLGISTAPLELGTAAGRSADAGATSDHKPERGADNPVGASRRRMARPQGAVVLVGLAYLLYVGCESGVAGWIPAHLVALGYSERLGTAVTSGFWAAMTVGRRAAAPLSRVVAAHRIVLAACLLLTLSLALTAVPAIAPECYAVAGFGAAPVFPIGLDWVAATFPGHHPATSVALITSFAGGIAGPAVVAVVVSVAGLHAIPAVLTALAAATSLAFLAMWWNDRRALAAASTGCGQGAPDTA